MTWTPDIAMVLAAGLGTRMRPLTDTLPKPLVRLGDRALIDHVLDRVAEAGVPRAVVNVHYKADALQSYVSVRALPEITVSNEREKLLDTGGGTRRALPQLGPGPFLVLNSDSVWIEGADRNLTRLFDCWDGDHMDCLLMLALASSAVGYSGKGDFSHEADGRVRRRRADESVPFVYTGVQIVHPRLFADAPEGAFSFNTLWNRAMLQGRAYAMRMNGLWLHVGSPAELELAATTLKAHS
jgi:N-acetyl-alpha-D-muramate 1-phosphate uridylyltransferase